MRIDIKVIFIIIIIVVIVIVLVRNKEFNKKNKPYYNVDEIEPKLHNINMVKYKVMDEVIKINTQSEEWKDWPEKELYDDKQKWKIYPLNVFGKWMNNNCDKCPKLTQFLKSIPNLKIAILSKMSGGTKLKPHQGWWKHSNYSIRCHYGFLVPENCFVKVMDNDIWHKKYHKQFEWLIFDDSKIHNAENLSNEDRIVLLIDVERPTNIKTGNSDVEDTKELLEILNSVKN